MRSGTDGWMERSDGAVGLGVGSGAVLRQLWQWHSVSLTHSLTQQGHHCAASD